jgi:hypothetical protein
MQQSHSDPDGGRFNVSRRGNRHGEEQAWILLKGGPDIGSVRRHGIGDNGQLGSNSTQYPV